MGDWVLTTKKWSPIMANKEMCGRNSTQPLVIRPATGKISQSVKETILLQEIGQRESNKEQIADRVAKDPQLISELIKGLSTQKADIKYGCAKVIRIISEREPDVLYPSFNFFVDLLYSDNNILQWEGIIVIGNLANVDSEGKIEGIIDRYLDPITGPVLVTAANIIKGAAKIASAKPRLAERITSAVLKVENAKYQTVECRNVALGHAVRSFDQFFDNIKNKEPVIALIRRQLRNTRNGTRKAAEKVVKKRRL